MEVTTRGGVEEVGRSCLEVSTETEIILVDCGLKQAHETQYPDLTGLKPGDIDAAILTHAHIDHIGGLPLLEARDLFADDAPIFATRPTDALGTIMLWDSYNLHKMQIQENGGAQLYQQGDVEAVLDRIKGLPYGKHQWNEYIIQFGNAGHLLGSAWVALEHQQTRVLFSGDLGGRSAHLPDIEDPPAADALFLESTYGDRHTHPSFRDARTTLFKKATKAATAGTPVLIPTFGMGRSQELLQLFREREDTLPDNIEIVYDGLTEDSTNVYHAFASDPWVNETILNYKINSGDTAPFLPDCAFKPETVEERQELVDGAQAPIIVAPSGMLTGGWSPFYLWKLVENYDDAKILFTGFQAQNTVGRKLLDEPSGIATVTISALMYPEQADVDATENFEEYEREDNDLFGFYPKTIDVPADWVRQITGLSGHAAANTLLQFARQANAEQIHLNHGEPQTAAQLGSHLSGNVNAETIRVAQYNETISVEETGVVMTVRDELRSLKQQRDALQTRLDDFDDRIQTLENKVTDIQK